MSMVIVPNELCDQINAKLDAAFAETPAAAEYRDELYRELLAFFDEHGYVPDFSLQRKETTDANVAR